MGFWGNLLGGSGSSGDWNASGSQFSATSIAGMLNGYTDALVNDPADGAGDITDMFQLVGEEALEEFAEELSESAMDIVYDMIGGDGTVGQQSIMDMEIDGYLQDYVYNDVMDKHVTTYDEWVENWNGNQMSTEHYAAVSETLDEVYDEIYGVVNRLAEIQQAMKAISAVKAFMQWAGAGSA